MRDQGQSAPLVPPVVGPVSGSGPSEASGDAPSPCSDAGRQTAPRRPAWVAWLIAGGLVALLGCGCCTALALSSRTDGMGGLVRDRIAVITIDGVIAGSGDAIDGYVSPLDVRDQLERAQEDDSVKAVVLRVDSPGGTIAASQEIARYVAECDKPVIVSSADVNASGAYMVSSQADEIWALPGTAVGSIGVITQIPNVERLLDAVGIEFSVITAGEYKDTGSPYRRLTKEERALIQGQVDEAYDQFIDIVAEGRRMSRSKVESLATGWVWSGAEARRLGLVDKIGTYSDALKAAARAGGIKGRYDVVNYDKDDIGRLLRSLLRLSANLDRLTSLGVRALEAGSTPQVPR